MTDFGDFPAIKTTSIGADSQAGRILTWMLDGKRIRQSDATCMFGCTCLALRICALRRAGHHIEARTITDGRKSFSIYWMPQTPRPAAPPADGQLFT